MGSVITDLMSHQKEAMDFIVRNLDKKVIHVLGHKGTGKTSLIKFMCTNFWHTVTVKAVGDAQSPYKDLMVDVFEQIQYLEPSYCQNRILLVEDAELHLSSDVHWWNETKFKNVILFGLPDKIRVTDSPRHVMRMKSNPELGVPWTEDAEPVVEAACKYIGAAHSIDGLCSQEFAELEKAVDKYLEKPRA